MSLVIEELLPKGTLLSDLPKEHQENLKHLVSLILPIRELCNFPWFVSSGYRTLEHHEEIYRIKNEKRMRAGLQPVPIPMGSQHLYGRAVDILDPNKKLQHWVLDHLDILEDQGIYCESFDACDWPAAWLHLQSVPPPSGKRFFNP